MINMSLTQTIDQDLVAALKSKDELKTSVLRMIKSSMKNAAIDAKKQVLDDEEVLTILKRELKKRNEAIATYQQGNRPELAAKEEAEGQIIKGYLPEMMSEEQVAMIVDKVIAGGADNIGAVMKAVMAETKGQADGAVVQKLVREKLQK